jgi:ATPase subunit of ABC transporter with duplicated ATPase domains
MLTIENLSKQYGPQIILEEAELFIGPYDRVGLVGPNGTGKTTLMRMIAGTEQPDRGCHSFRRPRVLRYACRKNHSVSWVLRCAKK